MGSWLTPVFFFFNSFKCKALGRGQTNSGKIVAAQSVEQGEIAWSKLGGHTESRPGDSIATYTQPISWQEKTKFIGNRIFNYFIVNYIKWKQWICQTTKNWSIKLGINSLFYCLVNEYTFSIICSFWNYALLKLHNIKIFISQ